MAQLADNHDDAHSIGNQPVVLIVEDHADVARLIGAALGQAFEVHFASNGEQGLAHAVELIPDLIITDVKMPYMDGLEMCRRVRELRHLRHIPVIVLSARTSGVDRIRGIEAGADAYMVKPFVAEELRILATKLLENRKILKETYSNTVSIKEAVPEVEDSSQMDDDEFLAAFAGLVDRQMADGVVRMNLGKIAVQLKMGESQLRRRILELTGKSAASYILQLRLEKAMRLLCDRPTMLIGDVAEQCGFSDVAYFSRVFRQHYGMAPSQVRDAGK
jgi:DNA-binding response OmpR family regulator